ncbi:hypothetical protein MHH81_16340 [Psychrobacillus sp. FSL H8-0484]|uniref:hypothetical protein n=1 Tax=Psychrobacillus sp. FSL H8-0484 TaxID=2921390 RepID=UPI0030FCBAC5
MKREYKDLEDQLRKLPKHSLSSHDKRKVIQSLRLTPKTNRFKLLKPLSVFAALVCIIIVAYLASPLNVVEVTQKEETGLGLIEKEDPKYIESFELQMAGLKSIVLESDVSDETLKGIRIDVFLKSTKLIPIDVWNSFEFRAHANPSLFFKDEVGLANSVSYNSPKYEDGYYYTVAFESLYANYSEEELQKLLNAIEDIEFALEYKGTIYDLSTNKVTLDALLATSFPLPDRDQEVIGVEGRIGILGPKQFVAGDTRRGAKLMLYFWGTPDLLVGKEYRVEAKNNFGETIQLSNGILGDGLYSEDAHILTSFPAFTREGKWQLSFYVDEELFEAFIIDVLPPLPQTEHYILLESPKELPVGEAANLTIESTIGEKQSIEVQLVSANGDKKVHESIFQIDPYAMNDAATGQTIFHYNGLITFQEKGIWTLIIDGEQTLIFEN